MYLFTIETIKPAKAIKCSPNSLLLEELIPLNWLITVSPTEKNITTKTTNNEIPI